MRMGGLELLCIRECLEMYWRFTENPRRCSASGCGCGKMVLADIV